MSIDFDALKKKLNKLQGQNQRSNSTWRPSEGKSLIRIVPWKEKPEWPFIELYFHYIGGKTQLSPITFGDPDPLVEFADKLRGSGDNKDDWNKARQFYPKLRTFAPVIVRGEEEAGVRFYGFGKTVYTQLLTTINDPDWGDITDPQTGRDISLLYTPKKKSDTNFAKTEVLVKPAQTPITEDAKLLKKFLNEQPDIYEIFTAPSYEELEQFLVRYLNPDQDESVTTEEKTPEAASKTDALDFEDDSDDDSDDDESDVDDEGTDIQNAFEDLFNEG